MDRWRRGSLITCSGGLRRTRDSDHSGGCTTVQPGPQSGRPRIRRWPIRSRGACRPTIKIIDPKGRWCLLPLAVTAIVRAVADAGEVALILWVALVRPG